MKLDSLNFVKHFWLTKKFLKANHGEEAIDLSLTADIENDKYSFQVVDKDTHIMHDFEVDGRGLKDLIIFINENVFSPNSEEEKKEYDAKTAEVLAIVEENLK